MDKDDPSIIVQRSASHLFVPTMDYEIGWPGPYNVNRYRTIFTTALVPLPDLCVDCAGGGSACGGRRPHGAL